MDLRNKIFTLVVHPMEGAAMLKTTILLLRMNRLWVQTLSEINILKFSRYLTVLYDML